MHGSPQLDFSNPVYVNSSIPISYGFPNSQKFSQTTNDNIPAATTTDLVEGALYDWQVVTSHCSTTCGRGFKQVRVTCVSNGETVDPQLCEAIPPPAKSAKIQCYNLPCRRRTYHYYR